jgi:hypothetical protein
MFSCFPFTEDGRNAERRRRRERRLEHGLARRAERAKVDGLKQMLLKTEDAGKDDAEGRRNGRLE